MTEDEAAVPVTNVGQQKRGRGPAKCTEFDKLRRHGKIPLRINDGETAPCCENASFFTTRVTWILKHHADMSFARWTDVPKSVKDELIDRVRVRQYTQLLFSCKEGHLTMVLMTTVFLCVG